MKNIDIKIESMNQYSWIDVARIFEEGIATKNATICNTTYTLLTVKIEEEIMFINIS